MSSTTVDLRNTFFNLGVFRGDHFKDGSIAGHWKMEMCTVIKCDPKHSFNTCAQVLLIISSNSSESNASSLQDQSWDYNFLSTSDTLFTSLSLSGTFTNGSGKRDC